MFEISEIRFLTRIIGRTFYLSTRAAYEYIMYKDIDHFEVIVEFDIENWLETIGQKQNIKVTQVDDKYQVFFVNESFKATFSHKKYKDFVSEIEKAEFNVDSVALKISDYGHHNFSIYHYRGKDFFAAWVDPYHKRKGIKACYMEPIHFKHLIEHGELLLKMVIKMAALDFDLHPEVKKYIIENKNMIEYHDIDGEKYLFRLLSYPRSYDYLKLLDRFGVLEAIYPLIQSLKDDSNSESDWEKGMNCLRKVEHIISDDHYFADSVTRVVKRNFSELIGGYEKSVLLKFSILFYNAHKMMQLKFNAPERYEDSFTNFCAFFSMSQDTCDYYALIVENSRKSIINFTEEENLASMERQYEFYQEFHDHSIDVLLSQFVYATCRKKELDECQKKDRLEYYIKQFISKYLEIQSINSEITTLEIDTADVSDAKMLILLDDVKKKVFLGNLRYDRKTIIDYINSVI